MAGAKNPYSFMAANERPAHTLWDTVGMLEDAETNLERAVTEAKRNPNSPYFEDLIGELNNQRAVIRDAAQSVFKAIDEVLRLYQDHQEAGTL